MTIFMWRGERIIDIEAWANVRGEAMVQYHGERDVPMVFDGEIVLVKETDDGEMPEHFWDHLRMSDGWHYTEISRRQAYADA